jgi:hypothetical protein
MLWFAIIFLFHLFSVVNFFKIRFFMFYTLFFQFVSVKDTIYFEKMHNTNQKRERENKFSIPVIISNATKAEGY